MYRWSIELEGIFVLPLAPRWVRHSYLSKEATIDPLYLWVIAGRNKRRKSGPGKYFPIEPPGAAGKGTAPDAEPAQEQLTPAGRQALAVETVAPMVEEMPFVLAVEPHAPAWAQHTVQFLQTGELPEEQEEAEKVAIGPPCTNSSMTSCTGEGRTV